MTVTRRAWLAAVLVVVVVTAGIWVSGGLITNDFDLAMALTAAWMGLAAAGCLFLAWRRPDLRVAVIGAYLLTAVVAGVYLGRSTFFDDEVNERVVRVTGSQNELIARGGFEPVAHSATRGISSTTSRAGSTSTATRPS